MAASGRRYNRRRSSGALELQRQALMTLVLGVLGLFIALFVLAYFLLAPPGHGSIRSVAPLLASYMVAGAEQDSLAGHVLYSDAGLREVSRDDVAAAFSQRHLFVGFDRVKVTMFRKLPVEDPAGPEVATARGMVTYGSGQPGAIEARLEMDDAGWRLRSIVVTRDVQ